MHSTLLLILLIIAVVIIGVPIIIVFGQYRRHRAPLKAVDPSISYSFGHHIAIVTIPMIRYRLQAKFKKASS